MFAFMRRRLNTARHRAAEANEHGDESTQGVRDTRREIVLMAVRDTLRKHTIPPNAVVPQVLSSTAGNNGRGVHLRLVVRDLPALMMPIAHSFQVAVKARTCLLDPLARQWLTGISWVIDAADAGSPSLPAPSYWTPELAVRREGASARKRLERMLDSDQAGKGRMPGGDFAPTLPMLYPKP